LVSRPAYAYALSRKGRYRAVALLGEPMGVLAIRRRPRNIAQRLSYHLDKVLFGASTHRSDGTLSTTAMSSMRSFSSSESASSPSSMVSLASWPHRQSQRLLPQSPGLRG